MDCFITPPAFATRNPQRWLEYGRLASLPLAILPIPPDSPLAASPTGRARLESPVNGDSFWVCNTMCQFSPCFIPRSGRSAPAPSPANHISIGGKKLGIGPGSAHKVVARWRRGACLQLPVLELLRFAASSAGRAQLRNVASQLGGSRPGKRSKYQIPQKQTARFCVLFVFVVSGSYLSSRAVASQVLSAYKGLTSVFGMGTGGTPWLNHRNGYGVFSTHLENCIAFQFASIKPSTY